MKQSNQYAMALMIVKISSDNNRLSELSPASSSCIYSAIDEAYLTEHIKGSWETPLRRRSERSEFS